ncbi:RNA polymerase beta'' subunit family protein [Marinitoga aeolica]|uniref:Uncharacterized protein n=1 Tax=Marinitoga aeolica TaxID=2809031 RepID=A0ABY8PT80_9BACT|nr:hypothetical protein [Marinitoga aeolica]WGS65833.1 hypothetical protein JRV97_04595 [Marinitoga aeolica]
MKKKNLILLTFIIILLIPTIYVIKKSSVKNFYKFKNFVNSSYMFKDKNGNVYVGFRNNKLFSFSKHLKKNWEKTFNSNILSFFALDDELILTTNDSNLYVLDLNGNILKKKNFNYDVLILKGKISNNKFLVIYKENRFFRVGELDIDEDNISITEISLYMESIVNGYEHLKIYPINKTDFFYFKKEDKKISQIFITYDEDNIPYIKKIVPIKIFYIKDKKYAKYGFPTYKNKKIFFSVDEYYYIHNIENGSENIIDLKKYYTFKDYIPKVNSNIVTTDDKSYFTSNFGDLFEIDNKTLNTEKYKINAFGDHSIIKTFNDKLYILSGNNFIIFDTISKEFKLKKFGENYNNFVVIDENNVILLNNNKISKLLLL